MRILLIPALNIFNGKVDPYVPYGLLSLQAATTQLSVGVDILRLSEDSMGKRFLSADELYEAILKEIDPEIYCGIGLSTVCNSVHHSIELAQRLKKIKPELSIFFGGPYVTKLFDDVLRDFPDIDAVFVGESETSFVEFVRRVENGNLSFDNIRGVVTRMSRLSCQAEIVNDLDQLPDILEAKDFLYWYQLTVKFNGDRSIPLEASRGCPLQCSFCSTRLVWGARVRRKSAAKLIGEMKRLSRLTGADFFNLIGDNLGVPRAHFLQFCEEFSALGSPFEWGCSLKLDRIDHNNFPTIWQSGCRAMFIGVESGSQDTLNRVKKSTNISIEVQNIRDAISFGFKLDLSFIIGFPWETRSDMIDTFNLHSEMLKHGANRSQVGVLCPIPGTDIVKGAKIEFDERSSYVAEDDLEPSPRLWSWIERTPALFSQFGHYPNETVSRAEVAAIRDASRRLAHLYIRDRKSRWNQFENSV